MSSRNSSSRSGSPSPSAAPLNLAEGRNRPQPGKLHCTACTPPALLRLVTTPRSAHACSSAVGFHVGLRSRCENQEVTPREDARGDVPSPTRGTLLGAGFTPGAGFRDRKS